MTSVLRKCLAGGLVLMSVAAAAQSSPLARHVSARIPVQGVGREIAADRATPGGAVGQTATVSNDDQSVEIAGNAQRRRHS